MRFKEAKFLDTYLYYLGMQTSSMQSPIETFALQVLCSAEWPLPLLYLDVFSYAKFLKKVEWGGFVSS